jgi:hypothetical protein
MKKKRLTSSFIGRCQNSTKVVSIVFSRYHCWRSKNRSPSSKRNYRDRWMLSSKARMELWGWGENQRSIHFTLHIIIKSSILMISPRRNQHSCLSNWVFLIWFKQMNSLSIAKLRVSMNGVHWVIQLMWAKAMDFCGLARPNTLLRTSNLM